MPARLAHPLLLLALLAGALAACAGPGGGPRFRQSGLEQYVVLALLADATGVVHAGTHNGVRRSDDAGRTWQPTAGLPDGVAVPGLSRGPGGFYAATGQGVYRSLDGRRWFRLGVGPAAPITVLSVAPDPADPQRLVAGAARQGIIRSSDGGLTWQPAAAGLPPNLPVYVVVPDPSRPGRLLAGSTGAGLFRSTDGGASWQPAGSGIPPTANVFAVAGDAAGWLVAGTDTGLFCSSDGGDTWQWLDSAFGQTRVLALVRDPASPTRLVAGADDGAYGSTDAGQTWQRLAEGLPPDDHVGAVALVGKRVLVGAGQVWAFDPP